MRNIILTLGVLAAIGITLPITSPANAEDQTVVIDHGHQHHGLDRHHHSVVIMKHREDDHHND
jgi:hypothetical protein